MIVITIKWIFTRNASSKRVCVGGESQKKSCMVPGHVIFWLQMNNEVMPSDLRSYIVKVI